MLQIARGRFNSDEEKVSKTLNFVCKQKSFLLRFTPSPLHTGAKPDQEFAVQSQLTQALYFQLDRLNALPSFFVVVAAAD